MINLITVIEQITPDPLNHRKISDRTGITWDGEFFDIYKPEVGGDPGDNMMKF